MSAHTWQNHSPGDLSVTLPEVSAGDVGAAVEAACTAAPGWAATPLAERIARLQKVQDGIAENKERLAYGIALETGKPMAEALREVGSVFAKCGLSIADANRFLADEPVEGGPHPALIRRRSRGPAAVIGPFNFPLHLGHGANLAHLLAGNPVIFKPSPLAAVVAGDYGAIMAAAFPEGVFTLLQGGANEGEALCLAPPVRSVCFTGSVAVGRSLAMAVAGDYSKELALELGGSNAMIVCADADLEAAAAAAAEGACLTAGQRCNATSRVIVARAVADRFEALLLEALSAYQPGDPIKAETKLGPLISSAAVARYERLCSELPGDWLLPGKVEPEIDGMRGHYVWPAVVRRVDEGGDDGENFVPVLSVFVADDADHAVRLQSAPPFGLTASIFTRSEETFRRLGARLEVANLYANLPTTFSPSTLPFGGLRDSGNGRPGGQGFIRFTANEQAVQWTGFEER